MPALGVMPNIFSDVYAGGALMIWESTASTWPFGFGEPDSSHYTVSNTHLVDHGQGVLIYPDFQVAIQAGKNITSHLPVEIYTKTGTLTLNAVAAINQARLAAIWEVIDLPFQPCLHQSKEE